jgi:hypothetical protein
MFQNISLFPMREIVIKPFYSSIFDMRHCSFDNTFLKRGNVDDDLFSETDIIKENAMYHYQLKWNACHISLKDLIENVQIQTYYFLLIWLLKEIL